MGSEWILEIMAEGCRVDSVVSEQGPVSGCCEYGDKSSDAGATEIVN
jgi:hypothetical protein